MKINLSFEVDTSEEELIDSFVEFEKEDYDTIRNEIKGKVTNLIKETVKEQVEATIDLRIREELMNKTKEILNDESELDRMVDVHANQIAQKAVQRKVEKAVEEIKEKL